MRSSSSTHRIRPSGAAFFEAMEPRQLLSAVMGTGANSGTLYIAGTSGNDLLSVGYHGPYLRIRLNGTTQQVPKNGVNRIEIQAMAGNDIVDWSSLAVNTYCNGDAGNDQMYGGTGNDSLNGAAGKDLLYGGAGNDRITGGKHSDIIYGQAGNDYLYGDEANDYVDGGAGKDHLFGVDGDDTLFGQSGNDAIYAGAGNDKLYGGDGNDILSGDAGKDSMYGQAGDDILNSAGDAYIDLVDAGDGNDTVTSDPHDRVGNAELINGAAPSDPVQPGGPGNGGSSSVSTDGAADVAFGDEAMWDANFPTAVAKMKALGVKTVRLFLNVNSFDERPSASDTIDYSALALSWQPGSNSHDAIVGGLAMERAFQLKADGFNVVMTVSEYGGAPPASAQQVRDLFTYLMNSPETPGSSNKLKNAVDYWEVGNEVDLPKNWTPSGANVTTGLQAYVDDWLAPAADVLHTGGEKVISSSVSWNPNDLETIIQQIKKDNFLSEVDALGFHPYGTYDPEHSSVNNIATQTAQALAFANAVDRPLVATEWNVRGYPTDGSRDAAWTSAISSIYQNVIKPSFALDFYYTIVNNYATRGGNPSARPAGLLTHDGSAPATTTSSVSDLLAYYNSPLVPYDPFYSMFASFNA